MKNGPAPLFCSSEGKKKACRLKVDSRLIDLSSGEAAKKKQIPLSAVTVLREAAGFSG